MKVSIILLGLIVVGCRDDGYCREIESHIRSYEECARLPNCTITPDILRLRDWYIDFHKRTCEDTDSQANRGDK